MKVYIASAYQTRDTVRAHVADLTSVGIQCTSRWLNEKVEITPGTVGAATDLSDEAVRQHVSTDLTDVAAADTLVLFTASATGHIGGGGRHVEMGYALALDKHVVVIGTPENVFQRGAKRTTVVADWHEAFVTLIALRDRINAPRVAAS